MSYVDDDDYAAPKPKRRKPLKLASWVRQRTARDTWLCGLGALVLFPLSLVVLWITFWVLWSICLRVAGPWNATDNGLRTAAMILLVLLFVGNYLIDRKGLESLEFDEWPSRPYMMVGYGYWIGGPRSTVSFFKIWLTIFFLGPRMLTVAGRLGVQTFELQKVDVNGCGKVLGTLLAEQRRVSFEELAKLFPKLDIERVKRDLSRFHGIVFLASDPPGMALTPDLQEELVEHVKREREAREES